MSVPTITRKFNVILRILVNLLNEQMKNQTINFQFTFLKNILYSFIEGRTFPSKECKKKNAFLQNNQFSVIIVV